MVSGLAYSVFADDFVSTYSGQSKICLQTTNLDASGKVHPTFWQKNFLAKNISVNKFFHTKKSFAQKNFPSEFFTMKNMFSIFSSPKWSVRVQ